MPDADETVARAASNTIDRLKIFCRERKEEKKRLLDVNAAD